MKRQVLIKQFLTIISAILFFSACTQQSRATAVSTPTTNPTTKRETETPLRYLALGDSYTIGEQVAETERWPNQLASRLQAQNFPVAAPEIIAKTGWTTDELTAAIEETDPQGPYDLVSMLIGVNNQYRGRPQDEYREQFAQLLKQAIAFAGGDAQKVFVVSIPDWGATPFASQRDPIAIAAEIDAFNAINREEAEKAGVAYIDITPISRRAPHEPQLVADDGLHPSGAMYTEWVNLLEPIVVQMLHNEG